VSGPSGVGARSYLYVPGDRPDRIEKALASGADAVVVDLEDAVAVAAKDEARGHAAATVALPPTDGTEVWVRINQGRRGSDDLDAVCAGRGLTGVFLPKASNHTVASAALVLGDRMAVALVESAAALVELDDLAGRPKLAALAMGEVDLAADLGIEPSPDGAELWPVRLRAVVASAAAGLRPPIGPVWVAVRDLDGLEASTVQLRRRGFGARQAIHPTQVPVINAAFTPTEEAVERARQLLDGADASEAGAWVGPDGSMVDEAVLRSARRTLGLAERWGSRRG